MKIKKSSINVINRILVDWQLSVVVYDNSINLNNFVYVNKFKSINIGSETCVVNKLPISEYRITV